MNKQTIFLTLNFNFPGCFIYNVVHLKKLKTKKLTPDITNNFNNK